MVPVHYVRRVSITAISAGSVLQSVDFSVGFFFVSCVVFTCSLDLLCFVLCIPPTVVLALTRLTEFLSGTRSPTTDRKLGNQLFIFAKTTSLTVWLYRNSNPDISFRRGVPFPLRR